MADEREPNLWIVGTGGNLMGDQWAVTCGTCGWEVQGSGGSEEAEKFAARHRCPPEEHS